MSVIEEGLRFLWDISVNMVNGHRVGAILVIGEIPELVNSSTGEIPNPLKGHPREARNIFKGTFRSSLAQFSQFDGFMGMDWDGCVEFCGRLIMVPRDLGKVPEELLCHGARHKAGWTITKLVPNCVSLVLSQDGDILVIMNGKILKKVLTMEMTEPVFHHYNSRSIESFFDEVSGVDLDDIYCAENEKEGVDR
jgi:DNA integrity scanning protein DisA with diadenylate cyclase activity